MAIIRVFLVDIKYTIEEAIVVHLYCRDEAGNLIDLRDYYRPNFYIYPKKDTDLIHLRAKISRLKFDDRNFVTETKLVRKVINCQEDNFVQVFTSRPETVKLVRAAVQEWDAIINCFEDDISLTRRYLLENKLSPYSMFEAEVIEHSEGYFKLVKIITKDISFSEPKVLSVCASYDDETRAISAISCIADKKEFVITWKQSSTSIVQHAHSEEDLLISFKHILQQIRPDIILFEDTDFRLADIIERMRKYHIEPNVNIDGTIPYVSALSNKLRTIGLNEVFLRRIIDNFINFSLVEKSLEHAYSSISGAVNVAAISSNDHEDDQSLNIIHKKSRLNYMLFNSLFANLTELFRLIGLRAADLLNFSLGSVIEWILIKECIDTNQVVLNKTVYDEEKISPKKYHPVIDPVPGIYENICVIDLTPLYPGIIIKNKLSPDTLLCSLGEKEAHKGGILPGILSDIISRIDRIEKALESSKNDSLERRRNILLRICNYFYEYLSSPYSRWYSYEILEQINTNAKEAINLIINEVNIKNSVIFSDYNELYIELKEDERAFMENIKQKFPEAAHVRIKEIYKRGFFLPKMEGGKKGFGFLNDKGRVVTNLIKYTYPSFVKTLLVTTLKAILLNKSKTEVLQLLRSRIQSVKSRNVPARELLLYSKLVRSIIEYNDKTFQYYVIKALSNKGVNVKKGNTISYVIAEGDDAVTKRATLLQDLQNNMYDACYYIEKVIFPAIDDVLPLKGIAKEEILEPKEQAQLDKFL